MQINQDADCRAARDKRLTLSSTKSFTISRSSHQDINGTEPESWPKKLKTIQVSPFRNINNFIGQAALAWDPKDQPFANISAQRCNDTILQATIEVSIQRSRCNEKKLDRLAELVFICQHDCYLCRQSGTRLWEPIPGPKTLTQTMGFAAGLLKALKSQEICLNNFHPSLSRIWPYLDFDNPATRDKPASSYRSDACILIFHNFVYSDISSLKVRTFWRFPPEQGMGLRMALNSCLM